jgi:hypothetical protein
LILIKPFLECIDSSLSNIVSYSTICKEIRCIALFPTFREDFPNRLDVSRRRFFWGLYLNSFRYASFISVGFFYWIIYNIFSSFLIDLEIVFNLLRILILVFIFKNSQYSLLVSKQRPNLYFCLLNHFYCGSYFKRLILRFFFHYFIKLRLFIFLVLA